MKQALLLIDIQNDYFPGGAMELAGSPEAAARAAALLAAFRRRSAPISTVSPRGRPSPAPNWRNPPVPRAR